jgi:lipoprotein-anchoring transpeptidase ErfK/SrfK
MVVRQAGLGVVVALVALVGAGCGTRNVPVAHRAAHPSTHKANVVAAPSAPSAPPGTTLTATIHGDVPGSPAPGAPETMVVPGSWYSYPSILPVIATAPNWVEVRLAQRPNGTVAWVPLSDVTIGITPFRVVIDLATEHLSVFEEGRQILDFPAGIGTPDDPTATGNYFMTMRVPAPDPGYGPFVLVTSAHSNTITDWAASGDAIIAIHGPITSYDDGRIGTTGAAISHGCVRLHDADLNQLNIIPPGTPIDIVAS